MRCKNCGCEEFYMKEVGPHIGAYCSNCDKWIKWLPRNVYENRFENRFENKVEEPIDKCDIEDYCPF